MKKPGRSGWNPLVVGVLLLAVTGIGALAMFGGTNSTTPQNAAASAAPGSPAAPNAAQAIDARAVAKAEAQAKMGPRKQASLPPIPFQGYEPPRPHSVITTAYQFAAEHPEILSYVPCFCGCERSNHGANHDCFVRRRADNGDVAEWDEHGVECAVCIDVANRSRQMHASGASVRDIRAAIDKEFGSRAPTNMKTPHPPGASGAHGSH